MTGSLLAVYCILIIAGSVTGGWLPALMRMTHLRTQLLMSFVAGLMLGIAMLHMLPHAFHL
ncbi:putative membrane protein, partial [Rhodopirellula maiorica SM1]